MEKKPDDEYWGTLINADKSPSPLLEQLCLGLAQLVSQFESCHGSTPDLTPDKLASFYRQVGGNYDALFLETKGPALSFIYQALGCFHTLQPTRNPYEAPSIPALRPVGFVRWQRIQLLLNPDEHSQYLQNAVCQWDVPNPVGGTFPKSIPRTAFPAAPDPDMLRWHEKVSRQLEKDHAHCKNIPPPRTSPPEPGSSSNGGVGGGTRHKQAPNGVDPLSSHEPPFYRRPTHVDTDEDDNLYRRRRRRSYDAQRSRLHKFDTGLDGRKTSSSRNPSPLQSRSSSTARVPTRSNTMRARDREYFDQMHAATEKKMKGTKHQYWKQQPEILSDSSVDVDEDDIRRSRARRVSIDGRPPTRGGRIYHLSPSRHDIESQRRHSHDAAGPYYHRARDQDYFDYNNNYNGGSSSSSSSKASRCPRSKMKFYENMFDEQQTRSSHSAMRDASTNANSHSTTLPYEIKKTGQIPRVQVRSDGSESSSSDRDRRPLSGEPLSNWARWGGATSSRPGSRKVPVYD